MSTAKAKAEIEALAKAGAAVELVDENFQLYALARSVEAPCPPWDRRLYDLLFPIPAAYDFGTPLDGFYLGLPYTFAGGPHNRVSGQTITVLNRQWQLVSWHYQDNKPFDQAKDTVESHIVHCRGFFLERGAVNART